MADETSTAVNSTSWMSDVQRALALILVGTFALTLMMLTIRVVIWGDPPTLVDLIKTLISALINVVMLVLGYFYGSSKAKEQSDSSTARVVEKLTSPPPNGPVAPVPSPPAAPAIAWWSLLTEEEKTGITAAAATDPRVQVFAAAAAIGRATPDELAYLVSKGLLTPERATAIQAT